MRGEVEAEVGANAAATMAVEVETEEAAAAAVEAALAAAVAAVGAVGAARPARPRSAVSGIAEWMERYTAGWKEAQLGTASPPHTPQTPPPPPPPHKLAQKHQALPQQQRPQQQQRRRRPPPPHAGEGMHGSHRFTESRCAEPGPAEAPWSYASRAEQVRARRRELEHAKLVRHVALIERHAAMPMGAQMGARSAAADS